MVKKKKSYIEPNRKSNKQWRLSQPRKDRLREVQIDSELSLSTSTDKTCCTSSL